MVALSNHWELYFYSIFNSVYVVVEQSTVIQIGSFAPEINNGCMGDPNTVSWSIHV